MAKKLQLRRGTTSEHSSFTGAVGEVTVDTDKDVLVVHDGSTAGGFPSVKSGSIATADLAADAVTDAKIAADAVGASELKVTGNGTSGQYLGSDADGTFTWTSISSDPTMGGDLTGTASNAQLAGDVVTSAELADNACNSEHYTDGSIDAVHLASGVALASGTKMVFYQASAPTGWTQDTTSSLANRALRIVVGSGGGTGGTHDLNSPPSLAHTHTGPSHTHTGPSHTHTGPSHTHTGPSHTHGHSLSAGAHTLSTSEMPSHTHTYTRDNHSSTQVKGETGGNNNGSNTGQTTGATGGGGSHSHSLSGSISAGGTGATGSSGTGATGSSGTGATGSSGTGDTSSTTPTAFAPKYVDVIVASKD